MQSDCIIEAVIVFRGIAIRRQRKVHPGDIKETAKGDFVTLPTDFLSAGICVCDCVTSKTARQTGRLRPLPEKKRAIVFAVNYPGITGDQVIDPVLIAALGKLGR